MMNRYKSGWFKDSHRHYLAAKYGSAGPSKRYLAGKGGAGADVMGRAFELGTMTPTDKVEHLGEETTSKSEMFGENLLPASFNFAINKTPDVKQSAATTESESVMAGSKMMDEWFQAGKSPNPGPEAWERSVEYSADKEDPIYMDEDSGDDDIYIDPPYKYRASKEGRIVLKK